MNWIKLTPETVLPDKAGVIVRIDTGLMFFYNIGFVTSNRIFLDDEEYEVSITHFALIEEPADVPKERAVEWSEEDRKNLPFDTE